MLRNCMMVLLLTVLVWGKDAKKEHRDYVPDENTAVHIAEAVLTAEFGEERVKAQLPLRGDNTYHDVWVVQGTEPGPPRKGGGIAVMINRHSGCIINVMEHMK